MYNLNYLEREVDKLDFVIFNLKEHLKNDKDLRTIFIEKLEDLRKLLFTVRDDSRTQKYKKECLDCIDKNLKLLKELM